jgi:hypothetical protein
VARRDQLRDRARCGRTWRRSARQRAFLAVRAEPVAVMAAVECVGRVLQDRRAVQQERVRVPAIRVHRQQRVQRALLDRAAASVAAPISVSPVAQADLQREAVCNGRIPPRNAQPVRPRVRVAPVAPTAAVGRVERVLRDRPAMHQERVVRVFPVVRDVRVAAMAVVGRVERAQPVEPAALRECARVFPIVRDVAVAVTAAAVRAELAVHQVRAPSTARVSPTAPTVRVRPQHPIASHHRDQA